MKISTYILTIVLTSILLFNSLRVSLTYAYFKLDPIGFVETLCENKNIPELECNGKCHLKKISTSQNKKQNTPESIIDFKELTLFSNSHEVIVFIQSITVKKQNPIVYHNLYSFNDITNCFHPPRV